VAEPSRRRGDDLIGADGLPALGHRLASSPGDLAAQLGRVRSALSRIGQPRFPPPVTTTPESLPSDLAAAHAMILAERAARLSAEAVRSSGAALIAHLKLQIEKLRRELYGTRPTARLDVITHALARDGFR